MPPPHVLCAGLATMPPATPPRVLGVRRANTTTTRNCKRHHHQALPVPTVALGSIQLEVLLHAHHAQAVTTTMTRTRLHHAIMTTVHAPPAHIRQRGQYGVHSALLARMITTPMPLRRVESVTKGCLQLSVRHPAQSAAMDGMTTIRRHLRLVDSALQGATVQMNPLHAQPVP